jgi:hypothetical protein
MEHAAFTMQCMPGFMGMSLLACFLPYADQSIRRHGRVESASQRRVATGGFAGSALTDQREATILFMTDIAQSLVSRIRRILYTLPLSTRRCIESLV